MIELSGLIGVVISIIIIGAIFGLLWWLVDYVGLPEPFSKIVKVVIAIVAVLIAINFLLGLGGAHTGVGGNWKLWR